MWIADSYNVAYFEPLFIAMTFTAVSYNQYSMGCVMNCLRCAGNLGISCAFCLRMGHVAAGRE